ncbi:MAG: hypothetical protein ABSD67_02530 [Terracidiphilus sp.]|jgi:hypothetical protein
MNFDALELAGDDAIVNDVVLLHSFDFATHGFNFKEVTLEGSQELERFPIFHFLNERTRMKIDISFCAATRGLNGGFTVLIIRPGNQKLDVEDYLKEHGREQLTKYFTYRAPAANVRDFADTFLMMLAGLLDRDLKPIIEGKTFEETPIDWMGYK